MMKNINTSAPGAIHLTISGLNQTENVTGPPGGGGGSEGEAGDGVPVIAALLGAAVGEVVIAGVGGASDLTLNTSGCDGGNMGAGLEGVGAAGGRPGTVKVPAQSGHFISWPAYCSGTVSIF
jgi:hypothetical protein